VFAHALEQIEKAETITWKMTYYIQVTSKDGKKWIETETQQWAYKAPGLYRELHFDENGEFASWSITDTVNREKLSINPGERKATFRELAFVQGNLRGPFVWEHELMQEHNLEWVGKAETETGEANIFRASFRDKANNQDRSCDFWIDTKTKQLVTVQAPGGDIYDPENDPSRMNTPKGWYGKHPIGRIQHDIIYNADLDESLFSLEPPEGYTVEVKRRPQVTEKEMVDYLGVLADYNNKTFPDQLFPFVFANDKFTMDRINKIEDKAEDERTAAEQKLIDTFEHYKLAGLNRMPTTHFVEDHTVKNSFQYLGKGVKLGDKERIVCWYKLKGSNTYRAVYGDLSVRDVALEDLPLPVQP
jgi:hypothetical protein